jgi:hypothetical protein
MMRITVLCMIMALAVVLSACAGPTVETTETEAAPSEAAPAKDVSDIVAKAAGIAKEIEADPENADVILANHEMTFEQFETMMYDISADPALSEEYTSTMAE